MRKTGIVSLVAGLAVAALPMAGAQAQVEPVAGAADDVPDIMAPYVIGQTVHDGGQPVDVDWGTNPPQADARIDGVGKTSDDRLAVKTTEIQPETGGDICWRTSLWLIAADSTAGQVSNKSICLYDDAGYDVGLSDSGDTFYEEFTDQWGPLVLVTSRRLDGAKIAERSFPGEYRVLDAHGTRIVVAVSRAAGGNEGLFIWKAGSGNQRVADGWVSGADVGAGIQWRRVKDGYYVARTLTNPKDIRWKLRFEPLAVAADGRKILGYQTNAKGISTGVVQVRLARSGELVRSVRPGVAWDSYKTGWDGNNTIFTAREGGGQPWLMRCPMKKPCQRAQDISSYEDFEVFEHQ